MSDHYDETKRLARLIGLDYTVSGALRTVFRLASRTDADAKAGSLSAVPWRPFENRHDCEPVIGWLNKHHPHWAEPHRDWLRYTCKSFCRAVLAEFDPPADDRDSAYIAALREQIRQLRLDLAAASTAASEAHRQAHALRAERDTARETNQRLNRRCQQAESMASEYNHAANFMPQVMADVQQRVDSSTSWLKRLRRTVHEKEQASWLASGIANWMDEAERLKAALADVQAARRRADEVVAGLESENKRLAAELADRDEQHRSVINSPCPDEQHCTCVPVLRREIEQLTEERDRLRLKTVELNSKLIAATDALQRLYDWHDAEVTELPKYNDAMSAAEAVLSASKRPGGTSEIERLRTERDQAIEDRDRLRRQWEAAVTRWDGHVSIAEYRPSEADARRAAALCWRGCGYDGVYAVAIAREWLAAWQRVLAEPGEPAETEVE